MNVVFLPNVCGWKWAASTLEGDLIAMSLVSFPTRIAAEADFDRYWEAELASVYLSLD